MSTVIRLTSFIALCVGLLCIFALPTFAANNQPSSSETLKKFLDIFSFSPSRTNPPGVGFPTNPTPQISSPLPTVPNPTYGPVAPTLPPIGPPTGPLAPVEYLTELITRSIHANCTSMGTGVIYVTNNYCADPSKHIVNQNNGAPYGDLFLQEIKASTNYGYVQCVGCARAMASANKKPYKGWGNAKLHIGQPVPGYAYIPSNAWGVKGVVPGSLFVISSGAYGHIGFVSKVNIDASGNVYSFRAQECNWGGSGYFRHDKTWTVSQVTGFQVPLN